MLDIKAVNHVGIRVSDKAESVAFYQRLGFELVSDVGFEQGHPVILKHGSGVVINLLGPATADSSTNILMDVPEKYPGYTHVALTVQSIEKTREFLEREGIEITGSFRFGTMSAVFIRDPDRNVIELDGYDNESVAGDRGYADHP